MITNIVQFFYPGIKKDDVKKVSLLALTFLSIIGAYWLLRLLKDVVMLKYACPISLGYDPSAGFDLLTKVKFFSPVFTIFMVAIYTKLVDMFEKHKLFYIVTSFYSVAFALFGAILYSQITFGPEFLGALVLKVSGSLGYLVTESFGSIIIALFWSFTISSTNTEDAKVHFPFIVALGQIGSIAGSSLMLFKGIPLWLDYLVPATLLILSILILKKYVSIAGTDIKKNDSKKKTDILGGIKLLLTKPYFIGILAVSTLYEIAGTIIDLSMKYQGNIALGASGYKVFSGIFGVCVNSVALILALLGTSKLLRKYSLRICIMIYPVIFSALLVLVYAYYWLHSPTPYQMMVALLLVMLFVKAASYAVSNPVKDMMYIPTTKDAKFKVKGVIDTIGARTAKSSGTAIVSTLKGAGTLLAFGPIISFGIMGVMIAAAIFVGAKNKKLVDNNEILGA